MKRIVMGFCIVALTLTSAYTNVTGHPPTQSRCSLTEAGAPGVRDIRLGMSLDQLLALFPGGNKRRELRDALAKAKAATGNETVTLAFDPAADGGGERFAGVESVAVGVYQSRVVDFNVLYVGTTWRTIDEWVAKLTEAYKLPDASGWVVGPSESPNKTLRCKGVEIEAAIQGGGSSIRVRNTEYLKGTEPAQAGEERKRREFKP